MVGSQICVWIAWFLQLKRNLLSKKYIYEYHYSNLPEGIKDDKCLMFYAALDDPISIRSFPFKERSPWLKEPLDTIWYRLLCLGIWGSRPKIDPEPKKVRFRPIRLRSQWSQTKSRESRQNLEMLNTWHDRGQSNEAALTRWGWNRWPTKLRLLLPWKRAS